MPGRNRTNPNQGRVYDKNGISPTLSCMEGGNRQPFIVENKPIIYDDYNSNIGKDQNTIGTLTTHCGAKAVRDGWKLIESTDRIRRLTPKECWRLFDFTDEDFVKAKNALNNTYYKGKDKSNSQLYKQAGNSIIINMLIETLRPLNLTNERYKVIELFGGIGAPRKALERLGVDFEVVDYVEINKYAVTSYNGIFNENYKPQDITEWNKDIKADIIFHGSPCTNMSIAGKQAGADEGSGTPSSLMHETKRIVRQTNPKYVIWENVKGAISPKHKHNFDKYIKDMENLNYNTYWKVVNGKDCGTPQNRERIIAISIRKDIDVGYEFPKPIPLTETLADRLEHHVDEKYYVKQELTEKLIEQIKSKEISNTIREGRQRLDRQAQLGFSYGITLKKQGTEFVKETDNSLCLLARDYKGFGNQEMTAVLEVD